MFYFRDHHDSRPTAELPRFETLVELERFFQEEAEARAEAAMEARMERFYEEGSESFQAQYRWEVEMDERQAQAFAMDHVL